MCSVVAGCEITTQFGCWWPSLRSLLQLLAYELRAIDLRHLSASEIAQQADSLRIDEPYFPQIEADGFPLQESFITESLQFLDPRAREVPFQAKLDSLI